MKHSDALIRNVQIIDGSGGEPRLADVAIEGGHIGEIGSLSDVTADHVVDGGGLALAPGFIDTHTHDDLYLLRAPEVLPKVSQGVTTVIVGNCGISAAPVRLQNGLPEPMNLLGDASAFRYPAFRDYVSAVEAAQPAVNVAALVGHTSLRNNHLDRLDRPATSDEITAMRGQLTEALDSGALGLSTGLAYGSAIAATTEEVVALCEPLAGHGGIYATHVRNERDRVLEAVAEALHIGEESRARVIVSHLKCAGVDNWGKSGDLLNSLEASQQEQRGWLGLLSLRRQFDHARPLPS